MVGYFSDIIQAFRIPGTFIGSTEIHTGNINQTHMLHFFDGEDTYYVLQRINTYVFNQPKQVMDNISRVTAHIRHKLTQSGLTNIHRRVLHFLHTAEGNPYVETDTGFWRVYRYIERSHTYDYISNPTYFKQAGAAFGEFQDQLADFPAATLAETIPHFHDTPHRLLQLKEAIAADKAGRATSVQEEIDFILSREQEGAILIDALKSGAIPYRVTHNDTKINNILFDDRSDHPICIIDLDTVMPGSSLYDFGDAIRSGSNPAGEDEENLSLVTFNIDLYKAFAEGFLEAAGQRLTPAEIRLLPISARILTLELCARFLTDYLNGDIYFKVKKPGHNLIRTRNQIELLRQMENQAAEMESVISAYLP